MDEPTSALDPEAEIEAFNRIRRLAALNRAVVLVTHRMSGVRHADRIYVLNAGHLAEHGTHDELITAHGRYAAMFDAQAAQYTPTPQHPETRLTNRHRSRMTRSTDAHRNEACAPGVADTVTGPGRHALS